MHPKRHTPPRWAIIGLAALALLLVGLANALPSLVFADNQKAYLPTLLSGHAKPFVEPATAVPTQTTDPNVPTETPRPATRTERPTATDLPTNTPGASPTPTLTGDDLEYDHSADAIVVQIGLTDEFFGTFSNVWEEMNGTPWLTVYGDGRILASKGLPNREHDLLVGQLDEYSVQQWLQGFAYEAQFFSMPPPANQCKCFTHPLYSRGHLHIFIALSDGSMPLNLHGYRAFEDERQRVDDPNIPVTKIRAVLKQVRTLEAWVGANLSAPYAPEKFTLVVQEDLLGGVGETWPRWTGSQNLRAIAMAAPTAASNYDEHVPGHAFLNQKAGEDARAVVVPVADSTWDSQHRAALFTQGGKRFVVGARPEVPGGSIFLPEPFRSYWYRRDSGSGVAGGAWLPQLTRLAEAPGRAGSVDWRGTDPANIERLAPWLAPPRAGPAGPRLRP